MKDYSKFEENIFGTKFYYNENNDLHKLNGAAIEYSYGDLSFCINGKSYMFYHKNDNHLILTKRILQIDKLYYNNIIKNINYLKNKYNVSIAFSEYINPILLKNFPNFIKKIIIHTNIY